MIGFNGGLIGGFRDTAGLASAPGVWTANEQVVARRRGVWPSPDPFFSSVSLLLPGDGANGSTSIIDRSPSPKTVTAFGNAQISTAQSKLGGSSIAFDGNGDFLGVSSGSSFNFGTADFTIEAWVYLTASAVETIKSLLSTYAGVASGWGLGHRNDVGLTGFTFYFGDITLIARSYTTGNTWVHVAVARDGTNLRMFFDGVQQGATVTNSSNITGSASTLRVGSLADVAPQWFNGFIDDVRITNGIARYTANFTPPTTPHPTQ